MVFFQRDLSSSRFIPESLFSRGSGALLTPLRHQEPPTWLMCFTHSPFSRGA